MKSLFSFASFVLLLSFTSCKSDSTATAGTAEAKAEGKEFVPLRDREITALIAYLQRLGTDTQVKAKN